VGFESSPSAYPEEGRRELIKVVIIEPKNISDFTITALLIYDGKLLADNKVFDWYAILVEGAVAPHHLMRIKVLLENHERNKYTVEQSGVRQEQVVYDALDEWGYRVIKKSIVCNIDYTEPGTQY
jgi:hypothetical protein